MNFEIKIDHALTPDYYPEFHCVGDTCRYHCCQGWRIEFSKKDYLTLKRAPKSPALKAKMAQSLQRLRDETTTDSRYAKFHLNEQGICPLLNERGLCSLQLECGGDVLPRVCQVFPRREAVTLGGALEQGCSTGCEEVVRLLLSRKDGLSFLQTPIPPEQQKTAVIEADNSFLPHFSSIRELCIDILQERRHTLPHRMLLLGMALQDLIAQEHETNWLEPWLARGYARLEDETIRETLDSLHGNQLVFAMNNLKQLSLLSKIYVNDTPFQQLCADTFSLLHTSLTDGVFSVDLKDYPSAVRHFGESFPEIEFLFENVIVNQFFLYKLPLLDSTEQIWTSYVNFCNLYSLFRFLAVCGCAQDASEERLIQILTIASRRFLHNERIQHLLQDEYKEYDSNTLAHMAILVCG